MEIPTQTQFVQLLFYVFFDVKVEYKIEIVVLNKYNLFLFTLILLIKRIYFDIKIKLSVDKRK